MEFGAQEWREFLFLRYGIKPPKLLSHCDVYGVVLKICHTLECKKGGLIMACNNKLLDGVADLSGKAFTPAHMLRDPKIFTGSAVQGGKAKGKAAAKGKKEPPTEEGEYKGDLLIRYLWTQGMDSIHEMRVTNTDSVSYQSKTPEKCLETAECEKKRKYLNTS